MLIRHGKSFFFYLCILALLPFHVACGSDEVFLGGCSITIPEEFELVRNQGDHVEYTKFGFPNIVSIETFKFDGDFLVEEFKGIPIEVVDTLVFDGVEVTLFDTLGMKESLNVRHVILENGNEIVLLTSFDPELFEQVFSSCLKSEYISQVIKKIGK